MKRAFLYFILINVAWICLACNNVKAMVKQNDDCYQNNRGVCLSEGELNKLKTFFDISVIDNFTQEETQKFLNSNLVATQTKYIKSVYQGEKVISNTEVTKSNENKILKVLTYIKQIS